MDKGALEIENTIHELVISELAVAHNNDLNRVLLSHLDRIDTVNTSEKTVLSFVNFSEIEAEDTHESVEIAISH